VYFALIFSLSSEHLAKSGHAQHPRHEVITTNVSAFSLSEMTSIPRETVRRKLTILMREGLITRTAGGSYSLTMTSGEILDFIEECGLAPADRGDGVGNVGG